MQLHESMENYLETLLRLQQQTGAVRSIDLARATGFSRPSVSRAVGLLRDNGFLSVDNDGFLHLTEAGLASARRVLDRHHALCALWQALGVPPDTAEKDACRVEHVISDDTYERIVAFLAKREAHDGTID